MIHVLLNAIRDIFDKRIISIALIPVLISSIAWGIIFWIFHPQLQTLITQLLLHIPFLPHDTWFAQGIELFVGGILYYQLVILTSVTLVGLVADKIIQEVNNKHYLLEKKGFGDTLTSILISLKQNLIFIILFILSLPSLFIPALNLMVNIALWMILIRKPMFYDSLASFATKEEFEYLQNHDKFDTFVVTFISALLFFVPILGIFVYIIQLLFFTHFNLDRLKTLRLTSKTQNL
ncbi:MAG: EI24 domain-containing protein [Epsilonproteobacteria bacterium]|nr:EI24 domain-containing protein [Campylobacterota bacterium]